MNVYILYSKSLKRFYVGQTDNMASRLERHNAKMVKSTKAGTPWVVVKTFEVNTRSEAMILERKIKSRGAKRFLEDINK